jgi:hypothetical protein
MITKLKIFGVSLKSPNRVDKIKYQ